MPGRGYTPASGYRYGFNGKEKDDEVKGSGNFVDFGERIYDSRIGRWLSIDPLQAKYPGMTPYNFAGNTPTLFADFDGKDFGVKIDHDAKTIVIVENIYTTNTKAYNQAVKAAAKWNQKSAVVDGYTVTFQIKVIEPKKEGYGLTEKQVKKSEKARESVTWGDSQADKIGNGYTGNEGTNSKRVEGTTYVGGVTANGKFISMNTHSEEGDMGIFSSLVTHEIGHTMGLDDKDGNRDGITDPNYPGDVGIMKYQGVYLQAISDADVKTIINYAKNVLATPEKTKTTDAKVILIEEKGKSDGNNPLGLKSEGSTQPATNTGN